MENQELNAMEALANAATPGPWHIGRRKEHMRPWMPTVTPDGPGAPICLFDRPGRPDKDEADSFFIAAARTFIPEAIAEIRRLSAPTIGEVNNSIRPIPMEERQPTEQGLYLVWLTYPAGNKARMFCEWRSDMECWDSFLSDLFTHWAFVSADPAALAPSPVIEDKPVAPWHSADLGRISELIGYAHAHDREVGSKMRELFNDFTRGKLCFEYNDLTGPPQDTKKGGVDNG